MSATEHHIEDDVEAPPYIVVPLSENLVNRAVFNAVADYEYGRYLESEDEIIDVWDKMMSTHRATIEKSLESVGGIDPLDEDDIERVYTEVKETLEQ